MGNNLIKIPKIKEGIVIDHIKQGCALYIVKNILEIDVSNGRAISIGDGYPSKKMGYKGVIKIENQELDKKELDQIALISPDATISLITNYAVKSKYAVKVPESIEDLISCPYKNCITNSEKIATVFKKIKDSPLILKCYYCERPIGREDIKLL